MLFLTNHNLNIRLAASICGGKLLSGGTESEAEWMKGSLATLVRGKPLKRSCRAREIDLPAAER